MTTSSLALVSRVSDGMDMKSVTARLQALDSTFDLDHSLGSSLDQNQFPLDLVPVSAEIHHSSLGFNFLTNDAARHPSPGVASADAALVPPLAQVILTSMDDHSSVQDAVDVIVKGDPKIFFLDQSFRGGHGKDVPKVAYMSGGRGWGTMGLLEKEKKIIQLNCAEQHPQNTAEVSGQAGSCQTGITHLPTCNVQ